MRSLSTSASGGRRPANKRRSAVSSSHCALLHPTTLMEGPSRILVEGGSPGYCAFSCFLADQQATYDLGGWAKITVYNSIVGLSPNKGENKGMIYIYIRLPVRDGRHGVYMCRTLLFLVQLSA